jgi:site-specific DNA-methyltransferase (adenine-specific)
MWLYGTGFPKGQGCLKPAWEPIVLARKPGPKVLPLGVDECRVPAESRLNIVNKPKNGEYAGVSREGSFADGATSLGRWPANVLHDGSDEVMEAFAAFGDRPSGSRKAGEYQPLGLYANGIGERPDGMERVMPALHGSAGTAARFFYCAKASKADRGDGNTHPTVKPIALMRWLVRLVCPAGGLVLDPFGGSGTTGVACVKEGRLCLMIEKNKEYAEIARARVAKAVQIRNQKPDLGVV